LGETARKTLLVTVEGRVQGVGYREFARRAAARLGVTGWARNRANGDVEALVCGSPDALDALLNELRAGPLLSRVTALRTLETTETPPSETFVIRSDR
jgi:acylphosphatase